MKPRLLDVCCCAGGAGVGYRRSGWDVTGVDKRKPSSYPAGEFIQADALEVLSDSRFMARFDAVHISPPCQDYIAITAGTNAGRKYPRLLEPSRRLLQEIGLPYVIECGDGKHLRRDLQLCGEMFGLQVIRHRTFEVGGWTPTQPVHAKHRGRVKGYRHGVNYEGYYYAVYGDGGGKGTVAEWQQAMAIDWTTDRFELREALPPKYTEFIGTEMLRQLKEVAA